MPSRGGKLHEYLKECAHKKIVSIYKGDLDFVRHEQPQNDDGRSSDNYFKVRVSIGSGWHDDIEAENLNFPDLVAQANLSDGKKIIIVECETGVSTVTSGKSNGRYHSYKIIKEKFKDKVFLVLATFKGVKVKTDLFDRVWRFKKP